MCAAIENLKSIYLFEYASLKIPIFLYINLIMISKLTKTPMTLKEAI